MSETFYICRCQAERIPPLTVDEMRSYQPIVTVDGDTTRWDCPVCGRNILLSTDLGTIDLDLVTDEQLDVEIFGMVTKGLK